MTSGILNDFQKITNYDVTGFFNNALTFFNGSYNTILNYYQGNSTAISSQDFQNLTNLQLQVSQMFQVFTDFKTSMKNLKYWLVLEQLESIDSRLNTLDNANRWARSSIRNFGYSPYVGIQYVMQQDQSLERISQDLLGSSDPQDDWIEIALQNNLIEEGYTSEGGVSLNLELANVNKNYTVSSIVDVIQGKSILGKDIYQNIQFVNDDLQVLDYNDTFDQSVLILIQLRQNGNPDFPEYGLQTASIIGSTRATLNFPTINRQLQQTFATDDSIINFTITSMQYDQDKLFINFTVQNRLGETVQQAAQMN